MGNMSYCRFENTHSDLRDCEDALSEEGLYRLLEDSDEVERASIIKTIKLCRDIADMYGDDIDNL